MSSAEKDVVYVDVDDEITGIIDKLSTSSAKIVALVLPKRASVFQSIVNMKLLKRRAEESKKHVVLITSEAALLPLAGAVGLHVAKTLQSKPEIPNAAPLDADTEDVVDEIPDTIAGRDTKDFDAKKASDKPIGELAGGSVHMAEETIELDNTEIAGGSSDDNVDALAAGGAAGKVGKKGGGKLKVPNFEKFRLKLALAGLGVVLLIVGWVFGFIILPKATVTIKTDASIISSNHNLTFDTKAEELDAKAGVVPAQTEQIKKTYTQEVETTGQKNKGEKASGTVKMTAKVCGTPAPVGDVPAGSGLTTNGLTFITQEATSFSPDDIEDGCIIFKANPTHVLAQNGGTQYNISPSEFTVVGRSNVTATSSDAMEGGTDDIVKVVSQSDIDNAQQKTTSAGATDAIKKQLADALVGKQLVGIDATFAVGKPKVTVSVKVGDEAEKVTVTEIINYSMFGVKRDHLLSLVKEGVNKQIDSTRQAILDDGIAAATFNAPNAAAKGKIGVTMNVDSTVGPDLDAEALKAQIVGKKSGPVRDLLKSNPGVKDVTIEYSPFWVTIMPKKASKITIIFEKPSAAKNADTTNQ